MLAPIYLSLSADSILVLFYHRIHRNSSKTLSTEESVLTVTKMARMSRFYAVEGKGIFWSPASSGDRPAALHQRRIEDNIGAWKVTQKVDFEVSLVYNNLGIASMLKRRE